MQNIFDFSGKRVVVTGGGGTGGAQSGKIISQLFAQCGASVAVVDENGDAAKAVADEIVASGAKAKALCANLCEEDEVVAMVDGVVTAFGGIDILVNNAFWHDDVQPNVADCTSQDWDRHIAINLRSHFLVTKYCLPHLLNNEASCIVNIGTTGAHRGEDGYAAYSAAKAGLESLTRSVATQYGRDGVRCNCVSPGLVLCQAVDDYAKQDEILSQSFARIDRNMLLGQYHGNGYDVAYAVLFFASPAARYITAQTLILDGGTINHFPQWADLREAGVKLG